MEFIIGHLLIRQLLPPSRRDTSKRVNNSNHGSTNRNMVEICRIRSNDKLIPSIVNVCNVPGDTSITRPKTFRILSPETVDNMDICLCSLKRRKSKERVCHRRKRRVSETNRKLNKRRSPYEFLDTMDWRLYDQCSPAAGDLQRYSKRPEIVRLISSFRKLYSEYSSLFPQESETEEQSNVTSVTSTTDIDEKTENSSAAHKHLPSNQSTYSNSKSLRSVLSFPWIKSKEKVELSFFDELRRSDSNSLIVYTRSSTRRVSHDIAFEEFDSVGGLHTRWIHLPLSLELELKQMKPLLDKVLHAVDYKLHSLEVVGELRHFQYDCDQCIHYFRETESLRKLFKMTRHPTNGAQRSQHSARRSTSTQTDNSLLQTFTTIQNTLKSKIANFRQLQGEIREQCEATKRQVEQFSSNICQMLRTLASTQENYKVEPRMSPASKEEHKNLSEQIRRLTEINAELKDKLLAQEVCRRQLYNKLQELQGNVRVYCRYRVMEGSESVIQQRQPDSLRLLFPSNTVGEEFSFERVFSSETPQEDVFKEFQPLVTSYLDGYHVCFITYGGEACGKTHTLIGNEEMPGANGLLHRFLSETLREITSRRNTWSYQLEASALEIYNDSFIDFFGKQMPPQLYVDPGLEFVHQRLKKFPIHKVSDLQRLTQMCRTCRRNSRTAMNEASSRSHLIILIRLEGRNHSVEHAEHFINFAGFCDLAGCEDITKAATQDNILQSREAGHINRSLTAFNRMFTMLKGDNQDSQSKLRIPFRESKLTHTLKAFLTNSSKCCLMLAVRNDRENIRTTHGTLRFGKEARNILLGKPKKAYLQE